MTLKLDTEEWSAERTQPKYERLCAQLIGDVQTGRLKPGDVLPPEPVFAAQLNLARSTVRQALAQMERNGLIRRIRGKGTYIHEEATSRLRSGLDAFALIVPDAQSGFYPSLVAGFEEAAGAVRNQVLLMSTRNDGHRQGDGILQLIDKQVAGVAIVPVMPQSTPAYQIRQLQNNKIPVVLCHRGVEGIRAPLLAFNALDVGRLAGETMARRGHRCVAFVSALQSGHAQAYEAGFREAMESAGGQVPSELVAYLGTDGYDDHEEYEQLMERALQGLMSSRTPPTAIFTGFDATAELIFLLLMRMGISVPGQMSLASFGGSNRLSPMQQRLTAVTVDEAAIGRLAVQTLDEMRRGRRLIESEQRIEIDLGISEGTTLARV